MSLLNVDKIAAKLKEACNEHPYRKRAIEWAYAICSDSVFQSLTHAVAALILGLYATRAKADADGNQIITRTNWPFLIGFIIVYGVILILFYLCNTYRKSRVKSLTANDNMLHSIGEYVREISDHEVELNVQTYDSSISEITHIYEQDRSFYDVCFDVCKNILSTLNTIAGSRNQFKVGIFVRNISEDSDTYQMVAFAPKDGPQPEMYAKPFDLVDFRKTLGEDINYYDSDFQELTQGLGIPCHAWPFLSHRYDSTCLYGADEVRQHYVNYHKKKPTKLHIAIPCIIVHNTVLAAIQITSKKEDALGSQAETEQHIDELYQQYIAVHAANLTMYHAVVKNRENVCRAVSDAEQQKGDLNG